jgi:hypothetical protein
MDFCIAKSPLTVVVTTTSLLWFLLRSAGLPGVLLQVVCPEIASTGLSKSLCEDKTWEPVFMRPHGPFHALLLSHTHSFY